MTGQQSGRLDVRVTTESGTGSPVSLAGAISGNKKLKHNPEKNRGELFNKESLEGIVKLGIISVAERINLRDQGCFRKDVLPSDRLVQVSHDLNPETCTNLCAKEGSRFRVAAITFSDDLSQVSRFVL